MGLHPLHYPIGIGAIANHVAAADRARVSAFGGIEDGLQRLPVGVEIAYNQVTHGRRFRPF
jgi:hypothetical protein